MDVLKIAIFTIILIISMGAVCATNTTSDDILSDDNQDTLETTQTDTSVSYSENKLDDSKSEVDKSKNKLEDSKSEVDKFKNKLEDSKSKVDNTFTDLETNISKTVDRLDITADYKFNNETDSSDGIIITKNNFVINGNGHRIDGNNQSRIFNIAGTNITINDLIFINGNAQNGGAIFYTGNITLNNVTFINNKAVEYGGAILDFSETLECYNSTFIDNYAQNGASIYLLPK